MYYEKYQKIFDQNLRMYDSKFSNNNSFIDEKN